VHIDNGVSSSLLHGTYELLFSERNKELELITFIARRHGMRPIHVAYPICRPI